MNYSKSILVLMLLFSTWHIAAQANYCVTGCNDNAYFYSGDPNTIEYDNLVGAYHSTIMKEANGKFFIWGQATGPNGNGDNLSPLEISKANGFNFNGTILKATSGGKTGENTQFAILTTEGLYTWGKKNNLFSEEIYNSNVFGKVTIDGEPDGLPVGVNPEDVKMLFGSYSTLVITTCTGEAYVLSFVENNYGDGTSKNTAGDLKWHRVKTANPNNPSEIIDLENVVAVRGNGFGFIALTSEGDLYTWGTKIHLGDNTSYTSKNLATKMTLPSMVGEEERVKMIGMTLVSSKNESVYYMLTNQGNMWTLGYNNPTRKMLGNPNYTEDYSEEWMRPQMPNEDNDGYTGDMSGIVWISPNEHDANQYGAINVITENGKLIAWGENNAQMLGIAGGNQIDPYFMPGDLDADDMIFAVETGGHTSMVIKQCSHKFGYVGHRIRGSMGNGSSASMQENKYTFDTAPINLCGALVVPAVIDLEVCQADETVNLTDAIVGELPESAVSFYWFTDAEDPDNSGYTNITQAPIGTYYIKFNDDCEDGAFATVKVKRSGDCIMHAVNDINQTPMNVSVDGNVLTNDFGNGLEVVLATYLDENGDEKTLPLGDPTEIYDEDGVLAGEITLNEDGSYVFDPAKNYIGDVPINYITRDENSQIDDAKLLIQVLPGLESPENYLPIAHDDFAYTIEGVKVDGQVLSNDSDTDGDNETLDVTEFTYLDVNGEEQTASAGATVIVHDEEGNPLGELTLNVDGTFEFTPTPGFTGEVPPIPYSIKDEDGGTASATLNIIVLPSNGDNRTFANDDANSAPKGVGMEGNILDNDFDPEDDAFLVTNITVDGNNYPVSNNNPGVAIIPNKGEITIYEDGSYEWEPDSEFIGTVVIPYMICDNGTPTACDEATLYLTNFGDHEVLPIKLLSFEANAKNNKAMLTWITLKEDNNQGFDIERSNDAQYWEAIGFVNSKSENGSSTKKLDYEYIDEQSSNSRVYYRLKQVDFDGNIEYSKVRSVEFNQSNHYTIVPNPTNGNINIQGLNGDEIVNVIDVKGRVVYSNTIHNPSTSIDLSQFNNGMYLVTITNPLNGERMTYKVIKN